MQTATTSASIDTLAIDTIRTLSMDAVQKANSGHPGTAMALAPVIYSLWQEELRFDPRAAHWPDRDRFVLSCGHASMLLYSTLFLAGVMERDSAGRATGRRAVSLEDIQSFRQLHSRTPGHPEFGHTGGVEMTTGPLGQGVATSVGMALAQRWLAARYNRPDLKLFEARTWVLCSDGDLMEGISAEAASLAGHLELSNLVWIWDNNRITIEGETELAFSEDIATRFLGHGWNVLRVADANDTARLAQAYARARQECGRPTLIIVDSHIGYGAPKKQDTHSAHGEPLGEEEIAGAKRFYGWQPDARFLVPEGVEARFAEKFGARGAALHQEWRLRWERYAAAEPERARELECLLRGDLPEGWMTKLPCFPADPKGMATRDSAGKTLNAFAQVIPWLLGGSADLAPSTKTRLTFEGAGDCLAHSIGGRNLHFGIREHAMAAMVNGMSLCGLRAYGATFLIFLDYLKPALRLAALMQIPHIEVLTHDSIGVGEDGPTHQPIEQLSSLRATPGVWTIRPCDANEAAFAWRTALARRDGPVVLALTRQALPTLDRTQCASAELLMRGGYVLRESKLGAPKVLLIATGSEVHLCLAAQERLAAEGIAARVVSLPCWELFEQQDAAWRESVLPSAIHARVAVEQAAAFGWERYAGTRGAILAMRGFGASAPLADLQKHFGFTPDNIAKLAREQCAGA
jgi:transketolase